MKPDDQEEKRGFKVQDRRRFSESGEVRDDQPEPVGEKEADSIPPPPTEAVEPSDVEINFATFVISLSTQALAHLGEIPNPVDGSVAKDMRAARQLIDILGLLREKTKGNLERSEETLLDNILYDLRMKFVEAQQVQSR